ncbi:MAG TPA: polysaccharide deacetylase family protein [Longimicrobiales bacterium]|nr:polysaccharide deacetylase family protein [Longimicrobiales bacterium]
MLRTGLLLALLVAACDSGGGSPQVVVADTSAGTLPAVPVVEPASEPETDAAAQPAPGAATGHDQGPRTELPPNEEGQIAILEYHLIGAENGRWTVTAEQLRQDMELLWQRGYRPITMIEYVEKRIDLPRGTSPVVFTFDDASPGQFRYLEDASGELRIDPTSAVGVWLDFARTHPGWGNKAVFCVLSGAEAGRSFFGNKGIDGQKTEWRHRKIAFLVEQGFEICNHTLWHATLSRYDDAVVQEQIARLQLAVDSAAPGYRIRSFALPLGEWPKNRALAHAGSWTDPKTGRRVEYRHDAVLRVSGGPAPGPHHPKYDPLFLTRTQVYADELERTLDRLDRERTRYVSDGDPATIAQPQPTAASP